MQAVDAGKRKYARLTAVILGLISAVFLSYSILIAAAYTVVYIDPGYFEREYEKYDVLSDLPEMTMSKEDGLMAVTDHMKDFLLHGTERDELQIEVMMDGEMRPFFSERELDHMMDVRIIFMSAIRFFGLGIVFAIFLAVFSRLIICHDEPKIFRYSQGLGMSIGSAASLLGAGLFAFMASRGGFSKLFVDFHHVMFDNDLLILDPSKDMLINIVPEGFFYDTAIRIGIVFAVYMVIFIIVCLIIFRSAKKMPDYQYSFI